MPAALIRPRFSLRWLGRRLEWELHRWLLPQKLMKTVFDGNLEVELRPNHVTDRFLFVEGHLEILVHQFIGTFIQPGSTVLDIGANIGCFTLVMAKRVGPTGRVVAFEPNPFALFRLKRHVALNGFEARVRVEGYCVADRTGDIMFDPKDADHTVHAHINPQGIAGIRVPSVTLDDYVEIHGLTRMDFVKVDTQGAECLVVRGAQRVLSKGFGRFWLCEVDDHEYARFGTCGADLVTAFAAHGYRAYELGLGPVVSPHLIRKNYGPGYIDLLFVAPGLESALASWSA